MTAQSELWKELAERLSIVAVVPFQLEIEGDQVVFTALLPQFGGAAGLVADPEWAVIEPYAAALIERGFGFSAVTLDKVFDSDSAQEMLRDWGWSDDEARPEWL